MKVEITFDPTVVVVDGFVGLGELNEWERVFQRIPKFAIPRFD